MTSHNASPFFQRLQDVHPMNVRAADDGDDDGNGGNRPPGDDGQVGIATKTRAKPKKPSQFKVLMLNDDYTPMEFVVLVLQKFFGMTRERATQVMLKVHREGMGVCGVYPRDVASTKVQQVAAYARKHQHPLQCVMEET